MKKEKNTGTSSKFYKTTFSSGKIIAGRYKYIKLLGVGGMGEVHLVVDINTGQKLAMKQCLEESHAKRFEREVLSWLKLGKHPNIVRAIFFDWINDVPTLFIEYVEGESLKDIIERSKNEKKDIPIEIVIDYAIQISRGMAHLHKNGIIHRDLKPSNILIAQEENGPGQIKITDMGLSKIKGLLEDIKENKNEESEKFEILELTQTKDMLGTPQYMSPQQYAYSKGVGEETDIYAFGVILYEMVTQGKKPFNVDNYYGWMYAHTYKKPKHVKTQVSSRFLIFKRRSFNNFYDLIMQCIAKKVAERPQSFIEIEERLKEIYKQLFGKNYSARRLKDEELTVKERNNQAVSLLEMGGDYAKEGIKKLRKLCEEYPNCLEAQINKLLYELKNNEITLKRFWKYLQSFTSTPEEKDRILEILISVALERGSYRLQSFNILSKIDNSELEEKTTLLRLKAKWLYFSKDFKKAYEIFDYLCKSSYYLWEDFYHKAGCLIYQSLENKETNITETLYKFNLYLKKEIKQKIWKILKEAEEECGPNHFLEIAKDRTIGGNDKKEIFFHECGILKDLHEKEINRVSISADGKIALSGGEDKKVITWDLEKSSPIDIKEYTSSITTLDLSLDGEMGIIGRKDGELSIIRIKDKKCMYSKKFFKDEVSQVKICNKEYLGIIVNKKGKIIILNLKNIISKSFFNFFKKKVIKRIDLKKEVNCLDISLDGEYICGGGNNIIFIWKKEENKPQIKEEKGEIISLKITSDNKLLIYLNKTQNMISVYSLEKDKKILNIKPTKYKIEALEIGFKGRLIFLGLENGIIIIYDLKERKIIEYLEGHEDSISDISINPRGKTFLSASKDKTIRLWENKFEWQPIVIQKYLKII